MQGSGAANSCSRFHRKPTAQRCRAQKTRPRCRALHAPSFPPQTSWENRERHDEPQRSPAPGCLPRFPPRRLHRLGGGIRHLAVPTPGRITAGSPRGRQRHRHHAHRFREIIDRARRPLRGIGGKTSYLVHRPHQGPREREILRPVRGLRCRAGRNGYGRRLSQRRRPHYLLHRRDPGEPGIAGRAQSRCRAGGDGRIPLPRRTGTWLGVAGSAGGTPPDAVRDHVSDPRGRDRTVR